MADELARLRRNIDRFDTVVTAKLRDVAHRKATQVQSIAERLAPRNNQIRGRLNEGNPHLADSITVEEDPKGKAFLVRPETPWNPNLGLWVELGTTKMAAQPFMRPAGDQVTDSYRREMVDAATTTAEKALGS